jgi:hypothetical protein
MQEPVQALHPAQEAELPVQQGTPTLASPRQLLLVLLLRCPAGHLPRWAPPDDCQRCSPDCSQHAAGPSGAAGCGQARSPPYSASLGENKPLSAVLLTEKSTQWEMRAAPQCFSRLNRHDRGPCLGVATTPSIPQQGPQPTCQAQRPPCMTCTLHRSALRWLLQVH